MEFNPDKVDDMVLALLFLTTFARGGETCAWKGHDWETMDRLHAKGYISDPRSKAKSVVMTDEGAVRSRELFKKYFADPEPRRQGERLVTRDELPPGSELTHIDKQARRITSDNAIYRQ